MNLEEIRISDSKANDWEVVLKGVLGLFCNRDVSYSIEELEGRRIEYLSLFEKNIEVLQIKVIFTNDKVLMVLNESEKSKEYYTLICPQERKIVIGKKKGRLMKDDKSTLFKGFNA